MRQSYKAFQFDSQVFHESAAAGYNVLNATLSNDFYMDCIRGPRTIIEDKIPGRDIPYFYIVDDEPLEFEVTFALASALTKTEIKTMVRKLFQPQTYKQLSFGKYESSSYTRQTPIYKVIFHGETDFNFVGAGKNGSNVDIFLGYFTLQVRADRSYGYNSLSTSLSTGASQIAVTNTGDISFYPSITFNNAANTANKIRLFNETNNSYVSFTNLYNPETITINATLKTLTSTDNTPNTIYERWEKNDLYLSPGSNTIKFQYYSGGSWTNAYTLTTLSVTGEAPVYIYDTN